jgi:hypothetical protein
MPLGPTQQFEHNHLAAEQQRKPPSPTFGWGNASALGAVPRTVARREPPAGALVVPARVFWQNVPQPWRTV